MPRRFQLITFDVYSALYDIEGSLVPAVARHLDGAPAALALVRTWRRKQLEYVLISNGLQQGRVPFRLITRRALDYALAQAGVDLDPAEHEALAGAWDQLQLWPEASEVLAGVKGRGYPLAFLSNGDAAMLRALAAQLPVPVDHVFASEEAGYYKPHPAVYRLPLQALALPPEAVLHVAGSPTDVMGTRAAGLRCAWSNRLGDRVLDPALGADFEFPNLRGVLSILDSGQT